MRSVGYVLYECHTPEEINIEGTKTWEDASNQDGKRPESITVNLLANGEKVDSIEVKAAFDEALLNFLEEAGALIESQTKRNTRVDLGQTKSKWTHIIDESNLSVTIGNPMQNAIWEEFGTGEYAANGNGRDTPWRYKDRKGWHTTTGKRPTHALQNALNSKKNVIIKYAQDTFGAIMLALVDQKPQILSILQ